MSDKVIGAYLTVRADTSDEAVRMMDTLSRVMLGLVMDGFEVELCAAQEPDYYGEPSDETVDHDENDE